MPLYATNKEKLPFSSNEPFTEQTRRLFGELIIAELDDESDKVLSHRLLNHDFITQLLKVNNRFKTINVRNLLADVSDKHQEE